MPPGKNVDDWWTVMRSGMWRLYFQLSPEGRRRYYDELLPLLHHTKAEILGERDDNAYYLVYLGTKPHARGRGYAGKLLRAMIERASKPHFQPPPLHIESYRTGTQDGGHQADLANHAPCRLMLRTGQSTSSRAPWPTTPTTPSGGSS